MVGKRIVAVRRSKINHEDQILTSTKQSKAVFTLSYYTNIFTRFAVNIANNLTYTFNSNSTNTAPGLSVAKSARVGYDLDSMKVQLMS